MTLIKAMFLPALLICALPLSAFTQTPNGFDRTATSSIESARDKDGNTLVTTINRRFTVIDFPTQPFPEPLLLREEFKRLHRLGIEGSESTVKVDAWFGLDRPRKIWTLQQNGDEGTIYDEFYLVTKYGCCANLTTNFWFNLETGQRVFSSTGKLLSVTVPNTSFYRYIAYHSIDAVIAPIEPRKPDLVGLLQYGSDKTPIWKLAIYSKASAVPRIKFQYENKTVESDSLMLWGVDGKNDKSSLSHFAIVISMGSYGDIVLPITNDALDLNKATVPSRYRIEIVK